jgi:hypothetical protein
MGVPIKKEEGAMLAPPTLLPAAPIAATAVDVAADKAKKRKR